MEATEHQNPPERVLLAVTSLLFIWTTLFSAIRCWAKTSQQLWSYFDVVYMTAFIACAAQCTTVFLAIAQYGFGLQDEDAPISEKADWMKAFYASDILYIVSIGLSRCSTAFFLSSLTRDQHQKVLGVVIATLAVAWAVASVFVVAFRGDQSRPWMTLSPPFVRWIGVEASGMVIELACWLFSINLVWTLNMPVLRRLKLVFIFAMRLFLIPIVALRLHNLSPSLFTGTPHSITMASIFTQTAMRFGLIAECLTCLRPFMQTFHEGLAPANSTNYWAGLSQVSQPGGMSNVSGGAEKDLKNHMRVTAKQIPDTDGGKGRRRYTRGGSDDGAMPFRSDRSGFSTRIESQRHHHLRDEWASENGDDDIELLPTNRSIHVRHTTTIS